MTPASIAGVRRAQPADVATIAALLTDAVMRAPVAEWLVPDPVERRAVFTELLAMDVDHAVEWGSVDMALDMSAVAVWRHQPDDDLLSRRHLARVTRLALPRFRYFNALVNSYRSPAPHHWLTWLHVVPNQRGLGLGRRLLAHHHQVVDRLGIPVDLVVSTERARDFLHHHGYRARLPLHLPSGPRLWPLRRPARPVAAHWALPARSA